MLQPFKFVGRVDKGTVTELLQDFQRRIPHHRRVLVDVAIGEVHFFDALARDLSQMSYRSLGLRVGSAGLVLFLYGHRRYADPNCFFQFGEPRVIPQNQISSMGHVGGPHFGLEDFERHEATMPRPKNENEERELQFTRDCISNIREARRWTMQFLMARTNLSEWQIEAYQKSQERLTARQAVSCGLAHAIMPKDQFENSEAA